jgi:hypothetical protein
MATIAPASPGEISEDRFFMRTALAMGVVIVAGFSLHLAMGRSTFAKPLLYHLHGLAFMGWVALFVTQARLATAGPIALHRKLGWVGAVWIVLLVAMGLAITLHVVREGSAPFFFRPQHFLVANPLTLLCFASLTAFAIHLRRQTDWHKRLHICGMAAIMGPAFGRILPSPLMGDYAFDIAVLAGLVFPLAGMVRDMRHRGSVHPAWYWGTLAVIAVIPLAKLVAYSAIGDAIYAAVTAGYPAANVPGLEFGPTPPGM